MDDVDQDQRNETFSFNGKKMIVYECQYPGCVKRVNVPGRTLCDECYDKVVRYEFALDEWLEREHPDLFLTDVIGWYTICVREQCMRDCLEQDPAFVCDCCPHYQLTRYIAYRIDEVLMPTRMWLDLYKSERDGFAVD